MPAKKVIIDAPGDFPVFTSPVDVVANHPALLVVRGDDNLPVRASLHQSVKIVKLSERAQYSRAHPTDAGLDLYVHESTEINNTDYPTFVGLGVKVQIPDGFVGLLLERSSSWREQISFANKVGVIDAGYRGELGILVTANRQVGRVLLRADTKIAQLVIVPLAVLLLQEVDELDPSARGDDGFGSTGVA